MIDTHAHLDMLEDAAAAIDRAGEAGVTRILTVGTHDAIDLAERFDNVWAIVGYHPHQAAEDNDLDELSKLLEHPKAVAVGEIGLDYYRDYAPRDRQQALFEAQLEIARAMRKPVVIHTRDADDDTRARLVPVNGTVVLHCFSSPRLLPDAIEHGWYVSFAGNLTYKNASDLRLAARRVPLHLLLLETDCPYLAPVPLRGRPNEPAYVMHTFKALASAVGYDQEALHAAIEGNATACFGL